MNKSKSIFLLLLVQILLAASCSSSKKESSGSINEEMEQDDNEFNVLDIGLTENSEVSAFNSTAAKPVWFKNTPRFSSYNLKGELQSHAFFDLAPFINFGDKTLNFVVTTSAGSNVAYGIDVRSGNFYRSHNYCKQRDVWKRYPGVLYEPPYTEGVIPRILDQVGKPQKIIVFGREDYYAQNFGAVSHRVKVIGGMVEQFCKKVPCYSNDSWRSRMILVAIDPNDIRYKNVKRIEQLKDLLDWDYVMAFLQNSHGRRISPNRDYPSYRVLGDIRPGFALRFATSSSHVFKSKELNEIRKSCFGLYDFLWRKVGKYQPKIGVKRNFKFHPKKFRNGFVEFHKKFGKKFQTCSDFVKGSSINHDPNRHWFFEYVNAFYKVQRLGYFYECSSKNWSQNPFEYYGKRIYDPVKELQKCTPSELDYAFPHAVNMMKKLKNAGKEYYRYIDYDNRAGGSHKKVYSWVNVISKDFRCLDKKKKLVKIGQGTEVFPKDIKWRWFTMSPNEAEKRMIR